MGLLWVSPVDPGILIHLFHMFPIKKEKKMNGAFIIVCAASLSVFPQ